MWGPPTDPQPSSCPPFCSTTSGGLSWSPDCTPARLPAQPGSVSIHQLLLRPESTRPTLGPQGFLLHKEWMATPV